MTPYIIITIALIAFIWISTAFSDTAPFTVINNHDGDTTTVSDKNGNRYSIRYLAVDANEVNPKQEGGEEAKQCLCQLLPIGSKVSIAFTGKKSHDRLEGTVYFRGRNINLAMLEAGHAMIDDRYINRIPHEMREQYYQAQREAIKRKLGRWGNKAWCRQTPWEFRDEQKAKRSAKSK